MVLFLEPDRSARSPFQIPIRTWCMSAWASRRFAATFRTAMEFTNQQTAVRRGSALDLKTQDKSRAFGFILAIRISFTPQRWAMFGT